MRIAFFRNRPVAGFYILALLGVILIMAIGIPLMLGNPAAASMMGDYFTFLEARDRYASMISIILFMIAVQPLAILILLFAAAPTIAAIIASVLADGKAGFLQLMSRFKPWRDGVSRQQGIRVWSGFFVIYFAISGLFLWLGATQTSPESAQNTMLILGGAPLAVIGTLLLGAFVDEGGTLEELGWRGYALPLLLSRMNSPMRATLLIAFLWWAWHLPRDIPMFMGPFDATAYLTGQGIFLLLCIAMSIVITYLFHLTGGSVWAGILIHGGSNVWSKALGVSLSQELGFDLRTVVICILAVIVLVVTKGTLGYKRNTASLPPDRSPAST